MLLHKHLYEMVEGCWLSALSKASTSRSNKQSSSGIENWRRAGVLEVAFPRSKHGQKGPCELGPTRKQVLLSLFLELFHKQVSTLPLSFSKKGDRDRSREPV